MIYTPDEQIHKRDFPNHRVVRKFTATYCEDCDFYVYTGPIKWGVRAEDIGQSQ